MNINDSRNEGILHLLMMEYLRTEYHRRKGSFYVES